MVETRQATHDMIRYSSISQSQILNKPGEVYKWSRAAGWWACRQVGTVVNAILQFTTGQEGGEKERECEESKRASKSSPNQTPTTLSIGTCFAIAIALWGGSCIVRHDGNVLPSTAQHSTAHSTVQLERLIDTWMDNNGSPTFPVPVSDPGSPPYHPTYSSSAILEYLS